MIHIAIVGASHFGLFFALALHRDSITCTIYGVRPCPESIGEAIVLSPNAPVILDKLGAFVRIQPESHEIYDLHSDTAAKTRSETAWAMATPACMATTTL
ncbi:hypothetical protein N7537_007953 [Penicillium hordei]|uniref:Uncharacterized protein n=1 Tax=Penicillium hordei TaxID=40994 RepID=A0AAD6E010_9EURO|nr:uncharacterized protein N7537_007953 [Penicillium hordei]KAJ5597869.1 hypothetical protein N7537_007953 [Penicillium hordei]